MATTKKKPNGRPTKLTPTLSKKLCAIIAGGNFFETACKLCRIVPKTGYNWLKKGENSTSGIYHDFWMDVMEADAMAEVSDLERIRAGEEGWQGSAWIRERRSRERWGRPQLEVTGKDGGPIVLDAKGKIASILASIASREGQAESTSEAQPAGS